MLERYFLITKRLDLDWELVALSRGVASGERRIKGQQAGLGFSREAKAKLLETRKPTIRRRLIFPTFCHGITIS